MVWDGRWQERAKRGLSMRLQTPPKVEKLRKALHAKAKAEPGFRFYVLYDKVYRADIVAHAYALCRANGGAAGVDGETFEAIESQGRESWLGELTQELRDKRYRAAPVRRVWLEKANGGQRPLGIPTIRDRVVQMAAVLVLEPIFEADLQPEQHAYRAGHSAHDAVRAVHGLVRRGHGEVVEADLSGYFDSIPHAQLMRSVARRVSDRHVLALLKQWLVAPVEESDGRGRWRRTTGAKDTKRGIPQGAPMTPRTQKVTFIIGAAVGGFRRVRPAARRAGDRNGMANGDFVLGDQNLLYEEADDTLPLGDVQGFGGRAQPRQKVCQGFGEAEIGLPILGAIDGGLQFAMQRLFLPAELRRSVAQLVDGDQLFLIGRDQAVDTLTDPDQPMPKVGLALLVGIGDTGRLQSPVDLCTHQCRIFEQADQLGPHDVVEQILAHRTAVAQRAVEIAPGVGT